MDTPTTLGLQGAALQQVLARVFLDFFQRAEASGQTIFLEDCHWLDASSRAVVQTLVENAAGLDLVATARPQALHTGAGKPWVAGWPAQRILRLEPLSDEAILEISREVLGCQELDGELVRFLHEKSEGNPFFAQELALVLPQPDARVGTVQPPCCALWIQWEAS